MNGKLPFTGALCCIAMLGGTANALRTWPTALTQYSWPLRLGGEIGVNFYQSTGYMQAAGPFVSVSGGRDGLGLNAGYKGSLYLFLPYATAGVGPSALYLWEGDDATYVGARGSVSMWLLSVFSGAYRRVSGDRDDEWMFSLGVGAGMP